MKFKIKAGTKIIARYEDAGWHIATCFVAIATDVDVTFECDDVWFSPLDTKIEGTGTETLMAANLNDLNWYKHVVKNFYGFHLPKNKKNVEQIIVEKGSVDVIDYDPIAQPKLSEDKRIQRRMREQKGGSFPGYIGK